MRKMIAVLAGAMLVLTMATAAMATQISGTINFGGNDILKHKVGATYVAAGTTIANSSEITFVNPTVTAATGDFASVTLGQAATLSSFIFSPLPSAIIPLWSVNFGSGPSNFTFDALLFDPVIKTGSAVIISGEGIITGTGFSPTDADFTITTSYSKKGAIVGAISFEASNGANPAPVPEPGTMMLLGAGFLGLAVYGKRRKNA